MGPRLCRLKDQKQARSSIGRVAVSKTVGWGFDSLRACQFNSSMKNPFRSTRIFLGEMVGELQKATWPTKTELRDSTVVVIVAALILGVFTSISDFSLTQVVVLFTDLVS